MPDVKPINEIANPDNNNKALVLTVPSWNCSLESAMDIFFDATNRKNTTKNNNNK